MESSQMLPPGRLERRVRVIVPLHLTVGTRQVLAETAFTENVSSHGARVLMRRRWQPDEQVQIESIQWSFRATARVAYCEPLPNDEFAVGLQFIGASLPLPAPEAWTQVP